MHPFSKRAAALAGGLIWALGLLAPSVTHGDQSNLLTRFSINQQFEVPGVVLEPNTQYVMKLLDSITTRNVVQVYNEDQTQLLAMFTAASAQRTAPEDRTVFRFIETQPGFPLPIRTWFYPGRTSGLDFIYPKDQASEIAAHAKEPVLTAESKGNPVSLSRLKLLTSQSETAEIQRPTTATAANAPGVQRPQNAAAPNPQPAREENAQIAPNQNEGNPKGVSQVQRENPKEQSNVKGQPRAATQPNTTEQRNVSPPAATEQTQQPKRLPQTAGELPLIVLIGMLCLVVGLGLKVLSAKS